MKLLAFLPIILCPSAVAVKQIQLYDYIERYTLANGIHKPRKNNSKRNQKNLGAKARLS